MSTDRKPLSKFVAEQGIKLVCKRAENKQSDDKWMREASHYSCTLKRGKSRMTVPFSMGSGHSGKPPDAKTVLSALASDASSAGQDFEDWAGDYGYETNRHEDPKAFKQAQKTWKTVEKTSEKLKRFMGDDYEKLLYETEED